MPYPIAAVRGKGSTAAAAAPVTLIEDTFTRADGALNGDTPEPTNTPGNTWGYLAGSTNGLNVVSSAVQPGTYVERHNAIDAETANLTVSVDGNTKSQTQTTTRQQSIIVRGSDWSNLWFATVSIANTLAIVEKNAGTSTTRASAAISYAANTDFHLSVTCSGESITAELTGMDTEAISYASASFNKTATIVGLRAIGQLTDWVAQVFDNFKVTA